MFGQLELFKKAHGHCNPPKRFEEDPKLGHWAQGQRENFQANKLSPDRIERLRALGFTFNPFDARWEEMFDRLQAFKKAHGHCNPPNRFKEDPELGIWTANHRAKYTANKLSPDRIQRLNSLGFEWTPLDAKWKAMFAQLRVFKKAHGHCNVPQQSKETPELANWVRNQRKNYKTYRLVPDRIQLLNSLGFDWEPFEALWETLFARLKAYARIHGNCRVSFQLEEDQQLANWVLAQRTKYKTNKLSLNKVQRLNSIEFEWSRST